MFITLTYSTGDTFDLNVRNIIYFDSWKNSNDERIESKVYYKGGNVEVVETKEEIREIIKETPNYESTTKFIEAYGNLIKSKSFYYPHLEVSNRKDRYIKIFNVTPEYDSIKFWFDKSGDEAMYFKFNKNYLKSLLKGEIIKDNPSEKKTWYKLSE